VAKTVGGYGISTFDAATTFPPFRRTAGFCFDADPSPKGGCKDCPRQPVLPGVLDLLEQAKRRGENLDWLQFPHSWVDGHLKRLELFEYFDHIICQDDVSPAEQSPPGYFSQGAQPVERPTEEAVVFEDSVNGVTAARRAGIFVVGVPNR